MTPAASVVWLFITALAAFAMPIGLLVWWRVTRKAKLAPFFVGALVFFVFTQVLEKLLHYACLMADNPVSRAINGNIWLYALYGGLAAGIFEEAGRYIAFRFLLTKRRFPERDTAVTYGIGHGGVESMLLVGVTFALYGAVALMQRTGAYEQAMALMKGDAASLALVLAQAQAVTPGACILSMVERATAIIIHISLSIFVFIGVRNPSQRSWFPFAIALHAIADMPAALYQKGALPLWAVELWMAVVALYALRSARKCYLELADP